MTVRVAGAADVDAVVATITTAFFHDPLWGPAFPDVARRHARASAFWRFLVTASLRHGWTHDAHRGKGLGMALLGESLARIDEAGHPAYPESSNPANDARYASVGFVPHARITASTGHTMTTMWRPAGGSGA